MTKEKIYNVSVNQDVHKVATDIEALAKKEHASVSIGNKLELIRILQMSCKADFAAAVEKLPSVIHVSEQAAVIGCDVDKLPAPKQP